MPLPVISVFLLLPLVSEKSVKPNISIKTDVKGLTNLI